MKILIATFALMLTTLCMASKCLHCGKELPSSVHINLANNQRLCPDCYNSGPGQEQKRSGQSCACRGACNCATTRAASTSPWVDLPGFLIGTVGVTELLIQMGFNLSLLEVLPVSIATWLAYSDFREGRNTPMESRNRVRETMRRIDEESDRRPNEQFNVLSDTNRALFNKLTALSETGSYDFTHFLHLLHFTWLHFHLSNSELNPDISLTRTLKTVNLLTRLLSDYPLICNDQPFEKCTPDQLLSQLESPVNLTFNTKISEVLFHASDVYFLSERMIENNFFEKFLLSQANKMGYHFIVRVGSESVGYAMFSLHSHKNSTFDMFETSSGIYRNMTASDVSNRIYKICKTLGVYEVSVWIYTRPSVVQQVFSALSGR